VPDPVVAGGVAGWLAVAGGLLLLDAVPAFLPVFAQAKMTMTAIRMSNPTIQPV
jgi:hypothetical protein